jgi:hypothetical protein
LTTDRADTANKTIRAIRGIRGPAFGEGLIPPPSAHFSLSISHPSPNHPCPSVFICGFFSAFVRA